MSFQAIGLGLFCAGPGILQSDSRFFRAGIEGVISFLKRGFGLDRCLWRGFESFQAYVQASVLACNLLTVARHALAAAKAA